MERGRLARLQRHVKHNIQAQKWDRKEKHNVRRWNKMGAE